LSRGKLEHGEYLSSAVIHSPAPFSGPLDCTPLMNLCSLPAYSALFAFSTASTCCFHIPLGTCSLLLLRSPRLYRFNGLLVLCYGNCLIVVPTMSRFSYGHHFLKHESNIDTIQPTPLLLIIPGSWMQFLHVIIQQ